MNEHLSSKLEKLLFSINPRFRIKLTIKSFGHSSPASILSYVDSTCKAELKRKVVKKLKAHMEYMMELDDDVMLRSRVNNSDAVDVRRVPIGEFGRGEDVKILKSNAFYRETLVELRERVVAVGVGYCNRRI